jgi:hypothetical protein
MNKLCSHDNGTLTFSMHASHGTLIFYIPDQYGTSIFFEQVSEFAPVPPA